MNKIKYRKTITIQLNVQSHTYKMVFLYTHGKFGSWKVHFLKKYTAIGINFGLIYFSLITANIRLICYHFEIF